MRNPLDKSSVAQSLDDDRLMGSLLVPGKFVLPIALHAQY
jgi:hypothetical protein